MSEYLEFSPPEEFFDLPRAEEMVKQRLVIAPATLVLILKEATKQIRETKGPNIAKRQEEVESWIEFWTGFLNMEMLFVKNQGIVANKHIRSLEVIADEVKKLKPAEESGVILMATGEGTDGHRFCVNWMKGFVKYPILLLEQSGYFDRNVQRRKPFLPLEVRLSMWAIYGIRVGLIPENENNLNENDFYYELVKSLGVDYSFASDSDVNCEEKRRRGRREAAFTEIPELLSAHTSQRVEKIWGDFKDNKFV